MLIPEIIMLHFQLLFFISFFLLFNSKIFADHFCDFIESFRNHFNVKCITEIVSTKGLTLSNRKCTHPRQSWIASPSPSLCSQARRNCPYHSNLLIIPLKFLSSNQVFWDSCEINDLIMYRNEASTGFPERASSFHLNSRFLSVNELKGNLIVKQIFQSNKNSSVQSIEIGFWSSKTGFRSEFNSLPNVYKQRGILQDTQISMAAIQIPPHFVYDSSKNILTGILGELWTNIADHLKLRMHYELLDMAELVGAQIDNNSWSGLMGAIHKRKFDIGTSIFLTSERVPIIQYLKPLVHDSWSLFFQRPEFIPYGIPKWSIYIQPFNLKLWLSLVLTITLIIICFTFASPHKEGVVKEFIHIGLRIFNMFTMQGVTMDTLNLSSNKILLITTLLLTIIVFNAYSAEIISVFITNEYQLPFTDIEGFLNYGKYLVRVQETSPIMRLIKTNKNETMRRLYASIQHIKEVIAHPETVIAILNDPRRATICVTSEGFHFYNGYKNIRRFQLPVENFLAFIVPKFQPYQRVFNWKFQQMRESGAIQHLEVSHIDLIKEKDLYEEFLEVDFLAIISILILLVVAYILAVIIFIFEWIYYRRILV